MQISVIIPTHNRYLLLQNAINSVLNQSYQASEIIVIDDGSSDETYKITKIFPTIKYFYQHNKGVSSARNLGIKKASHDWIAFLDSDDLWDREKLNLQKNFHLQNTNYQISYTDEKWLFNDKEKNLPKKYQKQSNDVFQKCLSHCFIAASSVMMKKSLFAKVGLFDENLEVCEDYDMWIKIAKSYNFGLINQKLITKNAGHENQLSFKHWGMDIFRLTSLQNIYKNSSNTQKEMIKQEMIKKLNILIIGYKKHKNAKMQIFYEKKLKNLLKN